MPRKTVPPAVKLYLFGPSHAENERGPIALPARKIHALLAYLILHPGEHPREKLAAIFWGDSPDTRARDSLRTALKNLRKWSGEEIVLADRETVELNPAFPLWVDVREFERTADEGRRTDAASVDGLSSAVALYRGDLLPGFYDDWILQERERFHKLYINALLGLTQSNRAASEYIHAMEYADRVLLADPANERAHQHLMFCNLALGDRSAALRQYEVCSRALLTELAVEPSRETTALYQWIQQAPTEGTALAAQITNLPIPLSSFIGRKMELAELKALVTTKRLVTLTGAGGSGKTRLAIRVATDLIDEFDDGVWWADLASLTDHALVPRAIAKAFGMRESPGQPLTESLKDYLLEKNLLLVLDNCEQLITGCAQLADVLLTHCARLRILATSREALGITGERVYRVPTLSLPEPQRPTLTDLLLEFEGIHLFVERAAAINADFELTEENAASVLEICRRLDGIPLALELAAARINLFSAKQIAERLNDRFNLLTQGSRTAPPRHQTLRATIDWSYDLLTETERVLFRRLSVFAGGFTLEAAKVVCAGAGIAQVQVPDGLSHLLDKSLVIAAEQGIEPRYRLLETIRQHAWERLVESGEQAGLQNSHLHFFLDLAEAAESETGRPKRLEWFNLLEPELDNLRAALEWSQSPAVESKLGLRLATALYEFWYFQGHLREMRGWLEAALARFKSDRTTSPRARMSDEAKAVYGLGGLYLKLGNNVVAKRFLESSLRLWRESIPLDRSGLARALVTLGVVLREQGDPLTARTLTQEALTLFREQGDQAGIADALTELAMALRDVEDYGNARRAVEEGATIYRVLGDELGIAHALHILGLIAYREGAYAAMIAIFEETLTISRRLGERVQIAYRLHDLGIGFLCQGDEGRAKDFNQQGEVLFRELGNKDGLAHSLHMHGRIAMFQEDVVEAEANYRQMIELLRAGHGVAWLRGSCLFGFAMVAAVRGQLTRAARLWGAAEKQIAVASSYWDAADRRLHARTIARAEEHLGAPSFESAYAEGQAMTLEEATEYALETTNVNG